VHEHLELDRRLLGVRADLVDRQLARHHDAVDAEARRDRRRRRRRQRHLRRRVEVERRAHRARDQRHRRVLHDQRVDAGRRRGAHDALDRGQLGLEHQRVHRQVAPRAGAVDLAHHRGQIVDAKVVGAGARVPAFVDAEVHRVGACCEGGGQRRCAAGRREDLGPTHPATR
jgi:hypothetical protein